MSEIQRVGVVGCGAIGAGFAEICARADLDVLVAVTTHGGTARGRDRVSRSLENKLRRGRLSEDERDAAVKRLTFTEDPRDLADRQLVLEAVPELLPAKLDVLATLGKVVEDEDAILASGTSSIPIAKLAGVVAGPGRLLGMHFFNPVPVLPLVELVGSLLTEPGPLERTEEFLTGVLGKQVIRARDRSGFVVNALLVPYLIAAVRMIDSGTATAEDIDRGMTLGCAHPMGPLALVDLIGLDVILAVGEALYEEYREPLYAPPPLLARMVDAGLLGKKSGRGFYDYASG